MIDKIKKAYASIKKWYEWHKRICCDTCLYLKCVSNWSPCYECKYFNQYERDESVDLDNMLCEKFTKTTNEDILQEIKKLQFTIEDTKNVDTAKEVFKELGWNKTYENQCSIIYEKGFRTISFLHQSNNVNVVDSSGHIDMKLLKAINNQCKELGWLDE